jgi:hypothetical protein
MLMLLLVLQQVLIAPLLSNLLLIIIVRIVVTTEITVQVLIKACLLCQSLLRKTCNTRNILHLNVTGTSILVAVVEEIVLLVLSHVVCRRLQLLRGLWLSSECVVRFPPIRISNEILPFWLWLSAALALRLLCGRRCCSFLLTLLALQQLLLFNFFRNIDPFPLRLWLLWFSGIWRPQRPSSR